MLRKHENRLKQLGLNITYYRKLKGYRQEDLAAIVGISRTHLSNIEAPHMATSLSLDALFSLADALEVDPAKLFELR
jgi:transcriptional regulator with XRE-family HTH domain